MIHIQNYCLKKLMFEVWKYFYSAKNTLIDQM